jgi:hypothetical protein
MKRTGKIKKKCIAIYFLKKKKQKRKKLIINAIV